MAAYEIHHGVAEPIDGTDAEQFLDGWRSRQTWGTMWHGTLENDDFRRAWLTEVAAASGSDWRPRQDAPAFAERRETMITTMADAVEEHLDLDRLLSWTTARPTKPNFWRKTPAAGGFRTKTPPKGGTGARSEDQAGSGGDA